jgi:hypothetical protein
MSRRFLIAMLVLVAATAASCKDRKQDGSEAIQPVSFNTAGLAIPDVGGKKLRGQVLYMPVYSNIPFNEKANYGISAFLAVHNTDLANQIKITKVVFFNTDGMVIKNFLESVQVLGPLATAIFTVPQKVPNGTGANFLVEWTADRPVNEPLTESVMKDLSGGRGISFLSTGRVVREIP